MQLRPDKDTDKVIEKQKGDWLNFLLDKTPRFDAALAAAQVSRWEAYCEAHTGAQFVFGRTESRLIVGLGAGHALETAITLDRNSGVPLIPGTAVKGLTRFVGLTEIAKVLFAHHPEETRLQALRPLDRWLTDDNKDDKAEIDRFVMSDTDEQFKKMAGYFRACFGWQDDAGKLVFPDAIYVGKTAPMYDLDIMNPHFGEYYIEGKAPAENLDPVPVVYLTVAPGQYFKFAVLPRKSEYQEGAEQVRKWLRLGLTQYGIGAKTNQGYGIFTPLKIPPKEQPK